MANRANTLINDSKRQVNDVNKDAQRQAKEARQRAKDQANRLTQNTIYDANSTKQQVTNQLANYDSANRQNRASADLQLKQNSRASEADRFEAQRNLQNAAIGLFGSMNQAMNGSTTGNLMRMLENRADSDNNTYWNQLEKNQNAVENAYLESYNQNQISKRDALSNALKTLRDYNSSLATGLGNIDTDLATNLSNIRANTTSNIRNINSNLTSNLRNIMNKEGNYTYNKATTPSAGKVQKIKTGKTYYQKAGSNKNLNKISNNLQQLLDNIVVNNSPAMRSYIMPDNATQVARSISPRNKLQGNDYFSKLINGFNF